MFRKLINKYRNTHVAVKASIWFAICSFMQKGIALLFTPVFTRILTTEQYGQYTVYQSWYSIVSILATLNLFFSTTYNGLTKFPEERKRFISSIQGLCTIITGILLVVYLLFSSFWNRVFSLGSVYMYAMFLQLFFVPAFNFWMAAERYEYRYKYIVIISVAISILSPVLAIVAIVSTQYKAEARVISYVLIQSIVGFVLYVVNLSKGKRFVDLRFWRYALRLNIPLLPHYLASVVLSESDRLMISYMTGKGYAAIYAVAYSVAMLMIIVVTSINNSFTPYIFKALDERKYSGLKDVSSHLVTFIGVVCLVTVSFGPEIIRIFAPVEYYDAIWIIPPVAISVFFCFLYPLFSTIELFFEKTIYVTLASMCAALLNVVLNYLFIPIYGYYAAGYTTLLCYIVYSFAHYIFSIKVLKDNGVKRVLDAKHIMVISVSIIFMMILLVLLYDYFVIRLAFGIVEITIAIILFKKNRKDKVNYED